jgi:hypothetical protein
LPPRRDRELHPEMSGPTGRATSTEGLGDPDGGRVASGVEEGAGAGMLIGTAVAGPVGLPIGAVLGAAAGAMAEIVDEEAGTNESRPLSVPGSSGTGPVDPAIDFTRPDRG